MRKTAGLMIALWEQTRDPAVLAPLLAQFERRRSRARRRQVAYDLMRTPSLIILWLALLLALAQLFVASSYAFDLGVLGDFFLPVIGDGSA